MTFESEDLAGWRIWRQSGNPVRGNHLQTLSLAGALENNQATFQKTELELSGVRGKHATPAFVAQQSANTDG